MTRRIIIWGLGKVGRALYEGFINSSVGVDFLILRESSKEKIDELMRVSDEIPANTGRLSLSAESCKSIWSSEEVVASPHNFFVSGDVVFAPVVDREINHIFKRCDLTGITLIHCSGATPIIAVNHAHSGVFYPLQSFLGKGEEVWDRIPVFIEGSNDGVNEILTEIALKLGVLSIEKLNSDQRAYLHLAGVFANNYTMAMAGIAKDLLTVNGLNPNWVLPILTKTAENFGQGMPWELMTGPASRADLTTIEYHRSMLENQPEMLAAYNAMAQYIINRPKDSLE